MIALRDLEQHLGEWREAGLLEPRQIDAIEHFEEEHHQVEEPRRIPVIAEAIGYLGAALAAAAVMTFAIDQWNTWSDAVRTLIVATATLAALAVGWLTRTSEEPAIRRFSVVMWTGAVGGTIATMFLLGNEMLGWEEHDTASLAGVAALVVATTLYLRRRHMLLQLGMLGGVLLSILPRFDRWTNAELWIGGTLLVVGLAWFALGWREILTPGRGARIAGLVVALQAPTTMYDGSPDRTWVLLLGAVLAIGVVGLSIVLRQPELTFLGAVFTFQDTLIWVNESFSGTLGVPVALLLAGTLAIGAALVLTRRMRGGPRLHG